MKGSVHLLVLRPKPRGSPGLLFVLHPTLDPKNLPMSCHLICFHPYLAPVIIVWAGTIICS